MEIVIHSKGRTSVSLLHNKMETLRSYISDTIKQLKRINNDLSNINGKVNNNISDAIKGINARIRSEEKKEAAIGEIDKKINEFVEHAIATDKTVAKKIHQNEKKFYKDYPWHKPGIDVKKIWKFLLELPSLPYKLTELGLKMVWKGIIKFVKLVESHPIIAGTVGAIVAVALLVFVGGLAVAAAVLLVAEAILVSVLTSIAINVIFALITGEDIIKSIKDGALEGYAWGGIFAGFSSILASLMKWTRNIVPTFEGFKIGKIKLWSPNKPNKPGSFGGTLIKFGENLRIDVEFFIPQSPVQLTIMNIIKGNGRGLFREISAKSHFLHFHPLISTGSFNNWNHPVIKKLIGWLVQPANKNRPMIHVRLIPIITPFLSKFAPWLIKKDESKHVKQPNTIKIKIPKIRKPIIEDNDTEDDNTINKSYSY